MKTPVTAEVVEQVRPEVPPRPEFSGIVFYRNQVWFCAMESKASNLNLLDIYEAALLPHDIIYIPGELEAAHLARRAELLEDLYRAVNAERARDGNRYWLKINEVAKAIDEEDAQYTKFQAQEATNDI